MTDRAGFFAGISDVLTELCIFYMVGGVFIMHRRGWGLHLGWLLLLGLVCAAAFALVLKKPRPVPVLTAMTGVLFVAGMALFILVSTIPIRFGYIFVMAIGAGMAVGLPLYFCLHRPSLYGHLSHLDALILALLVLLLCWKALEIDEATVAMMTVTLLLDAAAAVGLRMSGPDGNGGADVTRASLVALGATGCLGVVIAGAAALFSKSGGVTGAVLRGLGRFFAAVGGGLERFFLWLGSLLYRPEQYDTVVLEGELPSVAEAELEMGELTLNVNTTVLGVVLCLLLLAAAVAIAVFWRKKSVVRGTETDLAPSDTVVRRKTAARTGVLARLLAALRFRWTVFRKRNTPAGLLIRLERRGKRHKTPRLEGETMRSFLCRMDPSGGLDGLADALDMEYYGGLGRVMTVRQCRALGRYIRRV